MMNEYIFYTAEGYTEAPNDSYEVENCQMLGTAKGKDENEAQENLLKENLWISEAGFSPEEFFVKQVLTDEQRNDIKSLVNYLWVDVERHLEENVGNEYHLFNILKRLKDI